MTAPRLRRSTLYGYLRRGPTLSENQDPSANLALRSLHPATWSSYSPKIADVLDVF
ncbi:hypothetical protein BD779DRAFT_1546140, partial [Infundibulicybe gibba]